MSSFKVGDAVFVKNPIYDNSTVRGVPGRIVEIMGKNTFVVNWNPLSSKIDVMPFVGVSGQGIVGVSKNFLTLMTKKEEEEEINRTSKYAGLTVADLGIKQPSQDKECETSDDKQKETQDMDSRYIAITAQNYTHYRMQIHGIRGLLYC